MRKLFVFFTLITFLVHSKAKCDNVVVKGDTLRTIFFSPFDKYPSIVKLREKLKDYSTNCTEDNCSFLSTWKIVDNRLMLTNIKNCECNQKKQSANLSDLFGDRLQKGMLCADWYTGEIWVTKDQPNSWGGMFAASFPRETRLIIKKGIVISVKKFVYPKPVKNSYYNNTDSLHKFIYTHINWNKFPNLPEHSRWEYFSFDQDAKGYLINLKQMENARSYEIYDKDQMEEIKRVAGLLQWPLYYLHGQPVRSYIAFSISLSKEMKDKFARPD
ncbi:hypothetical protein HH214_15650 [Mucilaginibacter robiniae]|uniref:Uncharacterized protein n=1 Tax=Mucilaginibacter robiniae TaxID=2728022 RepID=A0A7L5E2E1_9SPHI|nr:hypothetical protein [Mucilaginibacter robiniae]QJD97201.1 hypothetical protein HH214_15650 [Mucilaginibacter robiniae]